MAELDAFKSEVKTNIFGLISPNFWHVFPIRQGSAAHEIPKSLNISYIRAIKWLGYLRITMEYKRMYTKCNWKKSKEGKS